MTQDEIKKSITRSENIISDPDSPPEMVEAAKTKLARLQGQLEEAPPKQKKTTAKIKKMRKPVHKTDESKKTAFDRMEAGKLKKKKARTELEKELMAELERCHKMINASKPKRKNPVPKGTEESLDDLTEKIWNLVKRKKGDDEKVLKTGKKIIVKFEEDMKGKVFGLKHTKASKAIIEKADDAIEGAQSAAA